MQPIINEEQLKLLTEVLLSLKTEDEARSLLSDLCTIREMQDLGQRVEVATISRVNRCLVYGAGGYRTVLERLEKGEDHD